MSNENTNSTPVEARPVGRPRTNFTRKVNFAKLDNGNWKVAGRGRPAADAERKAVMVAWDAVFVADAEYTLDGDAPMPVQA
tara:strand:+ start:21913 stop:22155 length:243 start_codon:yes stop_codon:yes gene_type:complete